MSDILSGRGKLYFPGDVVQKLHWYVEYRIFLTVVTHMLHVILSYSSAFEIELGDSIVFGCLPNRFSNILIHYVSYSYSQTYYYCHLLPFYWGYTKLFSVEATHSHSRAQWLFWCGCIPEMTTPKVVSMQLPGCNLVFFSMYVSWNNYLLVAEWFHTTHITTFIITLISMLTEWGSL